MYMNVFNVQKLSASGVSPNPYSSWKTLSAIFTLLLVQMLIFMLKCCFF